MLYGLDSNQDEEIQEFHQRVADRNIQSIDERQEEIQRARNSYLGILSGFLIGGLVGWIFFGPNDANNQNKVIPVVRRPITPVKIQPNEPGGMEIDNQDREIYHIVDKLPKERKEVNIQPIPEAPKIVVEKTIQTPDNIENLVESIEQDTSLNNDVENIIDNTEQLKLANTELSGVKTNSKEKIIIPNKIENINVEIQDTIKKDVKVNSTSLKENKIEINNKPIKGSWYTQIIASSSRKTVENLWNELSNKYKFLKEYTHEIEEITSANGSILYRLKVGSFKTRKEAENLSFKMKQNQISSIIKQN